MCSECQADPFDGPPLIEFRTLTGETIAIRRDLIALVMPDAIGSMIFTSWFPNGMHVAETPAEVLGLIRNNGRVVVVTGDQEASNG